MTTILRRIPAPETCALFLMLMLVGGCAPRLGRVPSGFKNDREAGLAVIGSNYTLSSSTTVTTDAPVHFTIKSNQLPAGSAVYPDYRGYVRPQPGAASTVTVTFSDPILEIGNGWQYVIGKYPSARTPRVRAIGRGTEFILEIDTTGGTEVHRVYFIAGPGSTVDVYVPEAAATPVYSMDVPGTYLEVLANNAWAFKGPYAADPTRAAFVKKAVSEINAAGVR